MSHETTDHATDHATDNATGDACGCPEYAALSRRGLLRGTLLAGGVAGASASAMFGSAFMETSYAATRSAPRVLVVLSMRGAVDGMSLVVPHGDPVYAKARPRIAIPGESLLAANGFFGLHPEMAPLLPLWQSGKVAAVHATGLPVPNRSHFAAMEEVEDADPGTTRRVGWLNRLVGRDSYEHPLQAIQLGAAAPPTSLIGPSHVAAVQQIKDMKLSGHDKWDTKNRRPRSMNTMWRRTGGPLGAGARRALRAVDDFAPVRNGAATPRNGASYPGNSSLGDALAAAARTIRGDVGAEVITIDHGSWDHHDNLGTLAWGQMQSMTREFSQALAAFFTDLGGLASKVTVVTLSEFGRRTRENANYGLDHGHGNVMLLLGAGVKGGYYGTWPGLTNTADADLLVTTDYRSVLAEVITQRLGASPAAVFPRFSPTPVGAVLSR
ncbi:DUF1501 domain-containing protein [Nocardioides panacisoli]|uniref:DUF1501 domain-containing protein n=1 Tax=Nocardioides panacisoli TaxID=627624 RepID=UPI001C63A83C|nr:DUF1501 domain-containing protein [Nocardioides panacisoli]QYJ03340.1 DUF1501 domain-containing protein [Nocardioides panacisoli]